MIRGALRSVSSAALLFGLVLVACEPGAGTAGRVPSDEGCDAASVDFLEANLTHEDREIVIERVSYCSAGLRIFGQVCRPRSGAGLPVLVFNHGGASGLGDEWNNPTGLCANGARAGFVVAASSYRGEDGSEGEIELCLGEVDDVIRMIEVARAQPYASTEDVGMLGFSHGGCIALMALAEGARVKSATAVFPPTDFPDALRSWTETIATSPDAAVRSELEALATLLRVVTGGEPGTSEAVDREYAARSPITRADAIAAHPASIAIVHGTADVFVPVEQSCRLVAAMHGFVAHRVDASGEGVLPGAPAACEGLGLAFQSTEVPRGVWSAERYFLTYEQAGHEGASPSGARMILDAAEFALLETLR